ncbi:MOSC domain-containing protein [Chloroflexia bacterium SDU3-3]|nr:MOSC domain-containing protein [Chloroflexia bacterium SDU3-3]
MIPQVLGLFIGHPHTYGREGASDPLDRPWTSGIVKAAVSGPIWLGRTNLAGDAQADLENHGGPEKAVCVYPGEHYPSWRAALGQPDFPFGAFGENITVGGQTEADVCIGDIFTLGDARVQVSQPRQPCWKLARRWHLRDLAAQVQRSGRTGWYLRVLDEGLVGPDAQMQLIERPYPEWSIAHANQIMHHRRHDLAAAAALADCPQLSGSWRRTLQARAERGSEGSPAP